MHLGHAAANCHAAAFGYSREPRGGQVAHVFRIQAGSGFGCDAQATETDGGLTRFLTLTRAEYALMEEKGNGGSRRALSMVKDDRVWFSVDGKHHQALADELLVEVLNRMKLKLPQICYHRSLGALATCLCARAKSG